MVFNLFITFINYLRNSWLAEPTLGSTISLLYLGVVATGFAWLIRFKILTTNGLVFQTQVAYLIPIFGVIFGFFIMDEVITWRVVISLIIIILGIYILKKGNKGIEKLIMQNVSLELSLLSIFSLVSFFTFLLIQKFSNQYFLEHC